MATKTSKTKTRKEAQLVRLLSAKAGYEITTEKPGPAKPTRYRIVGQPKAHETASAPAPAAAEAALDAG